MPEESAILQSPRVLVIQDPHGLREFWTRTAEVDDLTGEQVIYRSAKLYVRAQWADAPDGGRGIRLAVYVDKQALADLGIDSVCRDLHQQLAAAINELAEAKSAE